MRRHLPLISVSAAKDNNKAKAESDDMNCENGVDDDILGKIEENGCCSCKVSAEQQSQQPKTSLIQEKMEELMSVGIGGDDQDQDSYDLRENPKKSWKISDVRAGAGAGAGAGDGAAAYLCKECEKGFPSSRALAGHMRAHTVKGKKNLHICKKCSKGFESVRAMYGHMKSHSKRPRLSSTTKSEFDVDYPRKKRSVIRYKLTPNPSPSSAFGFVDEVEDAAVCLMMLSRDLESLDNDNAVEFELESKSFQSQSREYSVTSADEGKNPPPEKKMDSSSSLVSEIDEFDSEFGNHNNVAKKDAEIELEQELEEDSKIAKASSDSDSTQVEPPPEKDLRLAALGTDQDDSELVLHSDPVEKKSLVEDPVSEMFKDVVGKKRGYKCRTCNMIFSSHQALGGHRNRHKITINSSSSSSNSSSSAVMNEYCNYYYNGAQNQKGKDHECAVCFKIFPTGQALGGHKRAHYAGLTESRTKENTVGRNDHGLQQILDLNHQAAFQSSHHQQESTESELGDLPLRCGPEHGGHSREPLLLSLSLIEKTNSNS